MRYSLFVFTFLLLLGCERDAAPQPSGKYIGTFRRGTGGTVAVILNFSDGRFEGSASGGLMNDGYSADFPRICQGTFTLNGNVIDFNNSCFFTAEFDWSLILSGAWRREASGNQLILTYGKDRYELTRQP